jgi:hypothetical protein
MSSVARSQWPFAGVFQSFVDRSRERTSVRMLWLICALACGLRMFIAYYSIGTNDINTWKTFATLGLQGVTRVYALHPLFNHPPLMGWYSVGILLLSSALHAEFSFVFKIVPIIADTLSVVLVHRLGRLSPLWLLLYAVNPANVLVSAYHGNTDCMCALCCLASVYFANHERPELSGLSLGAALNVKLIPVVLIAPLALSFSGKRFFRFGFALAACALPFVPVVLHAWEAFRHNALQYNSSFAPWGLGMIASGLDGRLLAYQKPFIDRVSELGKLLILGFSLLLGLVQLWLRPFTRAQLAGLAFSWFLLVSPGFGAQYLVYPAGFLAVSHGTRLGFRYLYLGGAFAFLIYYGYWTGTIPVYSDFAYHGYDLRTMLVGFVAWFTLADWVMFTLQRAFFVLQVRANAAVRQLRTRP